MDSVQINLEISSISNVPLKAYEEFTFIVNDESFKTTKLVADLISNKICQLHLIDPTFDTFIIKTKQKGNFSNILNLADFKTQSIPNSEIPFYHEVFDQLQCQFFNFIDKNEEKINFDNAFDSVEENILFYCKYNEKKINFLASHFCEIYENHQGKLFQLPEETIIKILANDHLRLESEDQLLDFINQLYYNNSNYTYLYQYIQFSNVSVSKMTEFLELFDFNDMNRDTWNSIIKRLLLDPSKIYTIPVIKRYQKNIEINYKNDKKFEGLFNYINSEMPDNFFNEVNITSSSIYNDSEVYIPENVIKYENPKAEFCSQDIQFSWICFEFINHQIAPSCYIIRSIDDEKNSFHPKSWVVEGSNDNMNWDELDQQTNNSSLNGRNLISSFQITNLNSKKYKFIRITQHENWNNGDLFNINNIEFFGTLHI